MSVTTPTSRRRSARSPHALIVSARLEPPSGLSIRNRRPLRPRQCPLRALARWHPTSSVAPPRYGSAPFSPLRARPRSFRRRARWNPLHEAGKERTIWELLSGAVGENWSGGPLWPARPCLIKAPFLGCDDCLHLS